MKLTIWAKEITVKDTGIKAKIYLTKDNNGNYYRVKLTKQCNKEFPKDKNIFVTVVNNCDINIKHKTIHNVDKVYNDDIIYINSIVGFEEFVPTPVDESLFD